MFWRWRLKSEKEKLLENNIDLKKIIIIKNSGDETLFNLYKNATALIYPSIYEGFGMPIVEAMSLGCPAYLAILALFQRFIKMQLKFFSIINNRIN